MIDLKSIFQSTERKSLNDVETALDMTGDVARACLADEKFKTYRTDYEQTEKTLINTMLMYTKNFIESDKGDITKYALTMVRLMTRLQDLRYLIRKVEGDAKLGMDNGRE